MRDRTILAGSASKAYAMTGWRCGWTIAPPVVTTACNTVQGHSTSNIASMTQKAALAALTGPLDTVLAMRDAFDRRRKTMVDALKRIERVTCPVPEGAFYAFPDVSAFFGRRSGGVQVDDGAALAEALLEREGVAVVPGETFGAPYALRLSYACCDDEIEKGMRRVERFFSSLR
jgi:aspartate/methionine/tyrosine aminotransferase